MKKTILTVTTALIFAFSGNVSAQEWKITRAILSMDSDYLPLDTATSNIKAHGSLYINNGNVQMIANLCGVTCIGNTYIIKPTKISYANDYVAVLETGEEINIIQLSPELIINVHVPGVETNVFFLKQVK